MNEYIIVNAINAIHSTLIWQERRRMVRVKRQARTRSVPSSVLEQPSLSRIERMPKIRNSG